MTTLLLIRHGYSEANHVGIFTGHTDVALNKQGIKQAELTAEYIAENYKISKVYSSDLKRAQKTAECISKIVKADVMLQENLREIYGGEWEGVTFNDLPKLYPAEFDVWISDIGSSACVGGESVKQVGERAIDALTKIAEENDGKTVVVVTHGAFIRTAQSIIETGGLKAMQNIPYVSNASVTEVEYDGNFNVKSVSYDDHLGELSTVLPDYV
ncbi:MAG: histidine phosphatase family protein [Clostridia bacterium]|nr:histidine phosphatase family protein [Clostridia bacterium]